MTDLLCICRAVFIIILVIVDSVFLTHIAVSL